MSSLISPLEVYAVLQLDNIRTAFVPIVVVGGLITGIGFMLHTLSLWDGYDVSERYCALGKSMLKKGLLALAFGVAGLCLVPSTRTAAAMFILPALTSEQVTGTVSKEASELYGLAKQALKKAVGEETPAPTKPVEEEKKQ